jgi:hypothetical protein
MSMARSARIAQSAQAPHALRDEHSRRESCNGAHQHPDDRARGRGIVFVIAESRHSESACGEGQVGKDNLRREIARIRRAACKKKAT